ALPDANGTVAVDATAPIGINATTGMLTITQAGAAADGYLSATDWNTFNGKEPPITAGTTAQYWRGDKSFQDFATAARASVSGVSPITYDSGTGAFGFDQTANNTTNDARYLKLDASNDPLTASLEIQGLALASGGFQTTGGNARPATATDLQQNRLSASQV